MRRRTLWAAWIWDRGLQWLGGVPAQKVVWALAPGLADRMEAAAHARDRSPHRRW